MEIVYTCNKCGATKKFKKPEPISEAEFLVKIPKDIPCNIGNCPGRCIRLNVDFDVVDLQGKVVGQLSLTQESIQILDVTGVDLIMRFNSKTPTVTAWLD